MSADGIKSGMTRYEWVLLAALSVLWGGTFFFQEIAVRELPTFTIVAFRVAIAASILIAVMVVTGSRLPRTRAVWSSLLCLSVINNIIPFCLIVWGQTQIASGVAAILNATTPMFAVLVAHFATTDEKINGPKLIGIFASFAGVVLMIGGDALAGFEIAILGQLAVVTAACSYALGGIYGRRFQKMGMSPLATSTGQLIVSTIILIPIALLIDEPWTLPVPGIDTVLAIVALASLSTALAYVIFFRILATAGATNLMLVTFLIPVSALTLGIFILDETLLLRHAGGLVCIGVGLAAFDGRLLRRGR